MRTGSEFGKRKNGVTTTSAGRGTVMAVNAGKAIAGVPVYARSS